MSDLKDSLVALVLRDGYERREEPFQLSSGGMSHDYVDGKRAVGTRDGLASLGKAINAICQEAGVEFDAVGGLTMGADPIALAVVTTAEKDVSWFSVRKQSKEHGKQQRVEGPTLRPGARVLLVDDVVTTGRSILEAYDAMASRDVEVVFAVALVDRGEGTAVAMRDRGVAYRPVMDYRDLGIEPL